MFKCKFSLKHILSLSLFSPLIDLFVRSLFLSPIDFFLFPIFISLLPSEGENNFPAVTWLRDRTRDQVLLQKVNMKDAASLSTKLDYYR